MGNHRLLTSLATGALLLTLAWGLAGGGARTEAQSSFAAEVAALSEPAGFFDTDNLISNERFYLEVVPDLKKRGVRGGAYVGVGPDQNSRTSPRFGPTSSSSSTSGATICCCISSSSRSSRWRARGSSTLRCSSGARCRHRPTTWKGSRAGAGRPSTRS